MISEVMLAELGGLQYSPHFPASRLPAVDKSEDMRGMMRWRVGTCRDLADENLLRATAAECHACHVQHLLHGHQHVLARQVLGKAQRCAATWHNGHLRTRDEQFNICVE